MPDASFAEIAEDLRAYADNEARALEGLELFMARYPNRNLEKVLPAARRAALTAGRLAATFAALVPHEETVRDFVAGLSGDRPIDLDMRGQIRAA